MFAPCQLELAKARNKNDTSRSCRHRGLLLGTGDDLFFVPVMFTCAAASRAETRRPVDHAVEAARMMAESQNPQAAGSHVRAPLTVATDDMDFSCRRQSAHTTRVSHSGWGYRRHRRVRLGRIYSKTEAQCHVGWTATQRQRTHIPRVGSGDSPRTGAVNRPLTLPAASSLEEKETVITARPKGSCAAWM